MENKQQLRKPQINEIYRHFKGNLYKIITLAIDSETGEEMVVYQALYGDYGIYVRSLSMFTEKLDKKKYPTAAQQYRFESAQELLNLNRQESVHGGAVPEEVISKEVIPKEVIPKEPVLNEPQRREEESEAEPALDPLLEAFLEADSYRERLNILRGLEHRITQEMINTMAIVLDLEIPEGTLEKRYQDLENSILTRDKYECTRLR